MKGEDENKILRFWFVFLFVFMFSPDILLLFKFNINAKEHKHQEQFRYKNPDVLLIVNKYQGEIRLVTSQW